MAKGNDQLIDLLRPALAAGEELIGIARVAYNGTVPPNTVTLEASVSVLDAEMAHRAPDPDAVVAFPTAKEMVLALTGGRLFIWGIGFSGKPNKFVGEVPLSAVARIDRHASGYGQQITIVMKSGARVDLEFLPKEPAEEFTADLRRLIA